MGGGGVGTKWMQGCDRVTEEMVVGGECISVAYVGKPRARKWVFVLCMWGFSGVHS